VYLTTQKPNLLALRRRAGLSQKQLSVIIDVKRQTISKWERGSTQPKMSGAKFLVLCQTLNCSIEGLALAIEQTFIDEQE
jgi:DNA-binding XRE family transcriptional regulator